MSLAQVAVALLLVPLAVIGSAVGTGLVCMTIEDALDKWDDRRRKDGCTHLWWWQS